MLKLPIPQFRQMFVDLYSPDGELLQRNLSEMQVLYVQVLIAKEKLEGYYITWYGPTQEHHINITPKGELADWPSGMFDAQQKMFASLMRLRTDKVDANTFANITLSELFD